ncbi:hypothetical protein DdX_19315 [Ditylenchus destructor]|uniref:Uncharacterized protein n=1 Tax=Ditylenchus destructor TaxID=166010 RepID=A0AAD4MND8_9BILA|nr:hypothetical protein DdX_19315 [Ditylenchus destructor]
MQLTGLTFVDLETGPKNICWFACGDYKWLKIIFGLKAARCSFPCVVCQAHSEESFGNYVENLSKPAPNAVSGGLGNSTQDWPRTGTPESSPGPDSPEEIQELGSRMDNLLAHMRTNMPRKNCETKGHMFFRHGLEFTREGGTPTWFTEQAIESTHAAYAQQARRYKMVDDRRQIFMLKYWFSQCLLEASRPRPDDAEEYEFWDDPAFFYDDATGE